MSEQATIHCPHCAFTKNLPKGAIPETARQATCPKCRQAFPLNSETLKNCLEPPASTVNQTTPEPPTRPPAGPPSAPPPPPSRPVAPQPRKLEFSFNGSARDYFGIWIVNTLLKIVTIGFYSAWAKVRQRRFFYGSTTLQGYTFEYLADPKVLFRGWLIAAGAFVLYSIGTKVSPLLSSIVALVVFAAFPWLLVRSRMFNAHNSSYRNIRFGFQPSYREAYVVFAGLTILTGLSLGLLFPYMLYRQKKFMVENSRYGATPFTFTATVKDFYLLSLKVALGFVAVFGLIGIAVAMAGGVQTLAAGASGRWSPRGLALVPMFFVPLVYFLLMVYGRTALANLSWNGTCLGKGSFGSSLRTRDMALLFITNALAILFSLGLLIPWATVRMLRYRFEHLQLHTSDGLDNVLAAAGSSRVGAAGDEFGDVFDMPMEIAL